MKKLETNDPMYIKTGIKTQADAESTLIKGMEVIRIRDRPKRSFYFAKKSKKGASMP